MPTSLGAQGGTGIKPEWAQGLSYEAALARIRQGLEGRESLALLLVELPNFSAVQAGLGFEGGAALVGSLAERFSLAMREQDQVLRLGDANFCVLLGGIRNRGHAVLAAEKLTRLVDEIVGAASLSVKLKLHIGISLFLQHGNTPEELLRNAQLAVAAAARRNARLLVYDEQCATQVMKNWELGGAFARALDSGEVFMYYQPKVGMADGKASGAEALMRWIVDGKPVARPDEFIPLAEEAGLIENATWFALTTALRQAAEWPRDDMSVAVNVTPAMLHHREFVEMVSSAMSTWSAPAGRLTLEVTEGALIADFGQAVAKLNRMRDVGARISIDDFGTGYSSLSYFKKIPADELKIDKSFVQRMLQDVADQRLVNTILTLAKQFQLKTVAEGVEDQATFDVLAAMGCDYAQGYLYAPALEQRKFCEWLSAHTP